MASSKRNFTVVMNSNEHGLYVSSTPSSAARKAVSKLCADNKNKKVEFSIRETTQGSNKKIYGPYLGYMQKLDKPVELEGRIIRYKPIAKRITKQNNQVGGFPNPGDIVEVLDEESKRKYPSSFKDNRWIVVSIIPSLRSSILNRMEPDKVMVKHIADFGRFNTPVRHITVQKHKIKKIDSNFTPAASAASAASAVPNFRNNINNRLEVVSRGWLYGFSNAIVHPILPIEVAVFREIDDPVPPPYNFPRNRLEIKQKKSDRVTIYYLSDDRRRLLHNLELPVDVSNGLCVFHHIHPLLAITTKRGREVLIYKISMDHTIPPVLLVTLVGHQRMITAVAFDKNDNEDIFQIASGDYSGNLILHEITTATSPVSVRRIGGFEYPESRGSFASPHPITSIDLIQNKLVAIIDKEIWRVNFPREGIWTVNLGRSQRSPEGRLISNFLKEPSDLDAFHGSSSNLDYFDMKFAIFHPSGRFFATVNNSNTVSIWDNDMPEQLPPRWTGENKRDQPSQLRCKIETAFRIHNIRFSQDGRKIFLGCPKRVVIMDVSATVNFISISKIYNLEHTRIVSSIAMQDTAEGAVILVADRSGYLVRFRLDS